MSYDEFLLFLKKRPLSWSAMSSFEYDPDQWYRRYILNEKTPETKEMIFGKKVGERLASDPLYLPEVPRLPVFEHPINIVFNKIPLVGYLDAFHKEGRKMKEYKTGKRAWDQKRVDTHGQIDMYLLGLFVQEKIKPEDMHCELVWMPTQENGDFSISFVEPFKPQIFETKRTMHHVLLFGARINKTVQDMHKYVVARKAGFA